MNAKRIMITAAFVLLAGLCASAAAQRKTGLTMMNGIDPIPSSQEYYLKVNGIEASEGTVAVDYKFGESLFGYSFLGRTDGDLQGSLMLSMNCAPAAFTPGEMNQMFGGSWTLPVYMSGKLFRDVYQGSLYGTVNGGKMAWDKTGTIADLVITFTVDNGTKAWEGRTGEATFLGTLDESGKFPILTGELHIVLK